MDDPKRTERDDTGEWRLSARDRPATIEELETRIEVALARARSSETAAVAIGDIAIEAAEQARRAARLAESAARSAASVAAPSPRADVDARLRAFIERAERTSSRLFRIGAANGTERVASVDTPAAFPGRSGLAEPATT